MTEEKLFTTNNEDLYITKIVIIVILHNITKALKVLINTCISNENTPRRHILTVAQSKGHQNFNHSFTVTYRINKLISKIKIKSLKR